MANSRRRLPPVSESTSCLVGQPDGLRRQKPVTIKQTSTSLPNISKSCTSRKRRPNNLFQPAKVVARRYKAAVLKWLAVNRRKNMRGKQPWPASWPILGWHNKIRFVHFVQPLPVSTGRPVHVQEKKKTAKKSVTPCLQHRAAKMEGKALNPFIRIGGGYRQGYIVDPGPQVEVKEKGEVSVKVPDHQSVKRTEIHGIEVRCVKIDGFTADDALGDIRVSSKQSADDTLGDLRVSSKQSKRKKKKWGRNKAGERALVVCEGTDLSGVEEVDDERQLGGSNVAKESQEDSSSSSSDDSDAKLSQDGSVVNADSDASDQRQRYRSNKHTRTQSHKEDGESVAYGMSRGRRKRSVAGVDRHGSIGESSGDARAGYSKRKKRGKNRLASHTRTCHGEDAEDDDDKVERRGSPKRRRRKTRHGDKISIQSGQTGASGDNASELDDQIDDGSDAEKSLSLDDDVSVQTSRKPSSVSIDTEDGNEDGGGKSMKLHGGRDKRKRSSVTDVLANEISSEKTVHSKQMDHPTGSEQLQTNRTKKKTRTTRGSVTQKRSYSASSRSSKKSNSDQVVAAHISVSDSEPSVFSKDASSSSPLQPMDPHRRPSYLGSRKQSKGTSKSSVSQRSESNVCAESVGSLEAAEKMTDLVPNTGRKASHNRRFDASYLGSDSIKSGHESSLSPALPPRAPSPETTQLSVTATAPSAIPSPSENFLEPGSTPRKSEIKRRRSFQKGQEERGGLTVEQDSSDSDGGNVLEERQKERRRRLSKKHNVPPDPVKVNESEEQQDQPDGQRSAANTPYTPFVGRRKSQPGRESRASQSSQPRSTPATMETGETMSVRSGVSARQRRVGIDCSSYLGIRSTVLDTVLSSEDIRSSPQGSVISSDVSGVQVRTAECLEGLTGGTLSHVFSSHHPLENEINVGVPNVLSTELVMDERQRVATVKTSSVKPPMHRDSGEGDVDDNDDDDDDDIMPQDSQSSASGTFRYQRPIPSTTVSQSTRKQPPQAEANTSESGSEPAEEEDEPFYTSPQYCKAIDTDSGGRSTSDSLSVFGNETDIRSSIIASHAGRRISGSVSTVVSQRGAKKWHKGVLHPRNLQGSESTVLPTASEVVVGNLAHRPPTPYLNIGSEDSGETDEGFEKDSRSPSPTSIASGKESELPTPADQMNATSVSSADRHESSDSSSQSDGQNWKRMKDLSHVSHKLLASHSENNPDTLKNLLPSSPSIAVMGGLTQNGAIGLQTGLSAGVGLSVSHRAFQNRIHHHSSSLSGSNNDLTSEGGNSGSDEEERSDGGCVAVNASEGTTEQGDDVPEAEPLSRKPWEDLNRRGAQQRRKMQIQIRAEQVLQRAQADSANAKRKVRNGAAIDFLAQYYLVDRAKLWGYARAFAAEDEDEDGIISFQQLMLTLETIRSTSNMSRAQLDYVFNVLDLEDAKITFQMFAVIVALCERISAVANEAKDALDGLDMIAIEKKLEYYMRLFLSSDDDEDYDGKQRTVYSSSVKTSLLRIELKAGGLSRQMEDQVVRRCDLLGKGRVMFLDYVAYIPLFIYMHDKICDNPLSREPLGPSDRPEDCSGSESPVDKKSQLESTSLPPVVLRLGSGSSVASSFLGGTLLLKQARSLLARQASIVQSRTQMEHAQSVTSLVQDGGKPTQAFQLPPIVGSSTKKSHSRASSNGLGGLGDLSPTKEDEAKRLQTSVVGGSLVRSDRNRPGSSSSDSSHVPVELIRGKKTSTSSIRSSLKLVGGGRTAADRIRRITQRFCESPESDDILSSGDHDSRSTSPSLLSSNPPSRVSIRRAEGTIERLVVVDEASPSEQEIIDPQYCHPPLGRLVVPPPALPAAVRKLRTRSPVELSPTPFTSSSGRTSPSNSVYSSIQASLIRGTST